MYLHTHSKIIKVESLECDQRCFSPSPHFLCFALAFRFSKINMHIYNNKLLQQLIELLKAESKGPSGWCPAQISLGFQVIELDRVEPDGVKEG